MTTAIGILAALSAAAGSSVAVAAPANGTAAGRQVVVTTTASRFGRVLVTASGMSLYVFTGDSLPFSPKGFQVPCTALNKAPDGLKCTSVWTPLLATGQLVARGGVLQRRLGTVTRNGVKQVTYFGEPLYGFTGDGAAHQFNGQDFPQFNGMWYLQRPSGGSVVPGVAVKVERTALGVVLDSPTAAGVRTLYTLSFDGRNTTTCQGPCTGFWPPLLTSHPAMAGPGVSGGALGTLRRRDGSFQVTYHGHPLYFFAFDLGAGARPGLTLGEYLITAPFSGIWYTVTPQGTPDPGRTTIGVEHSPAGTILSVTAGITQTAATLYAFSTDSPTMSMCTGQCAQFWPPVLTTRRALSLLGIRPRHLGMLRRPDGTFQVTYFGHPLYFFALALNSGTGGAGAPVFGGTFNIVKANGTVG
jgi:predicted lipoprotein with Yx(FWY)xxD motif